MGSGSVSVSRVLSTSSTLNNNGPPPCFRSSPKVLMSQIPASPVPVTLTHTGISPEKLSCFATPPPVSMVMGCRESELTRPLQSCSPLMLTGLGSSPLSSFVGGASPGWTTSEVDADCDSPTESEMSSASGSLSANVRPSLRMAWRSGESLAALAKCGASGDWVM